MENDLEIWEMERYIWEMASMHGTRLKYLRNGLSVFKMAYEFDKRLTYVGNGVYFWELA